MGDTVALLLEHRTCNLQVAGLSTWLGIVFGKLLIPVCLCHESSQDKRLLQLWQARNWIGKIYSNIN